MDYVKMRAIAERLDAFAETLEGSWSVEIGPSGPVLAMARRPVRHAGAARRIREQLDKQVPVSHPGHVCAAGPFIEHLGLGRMRRPDAVVVPGAALDEDGLAVDAALVLAVVEIAPPSGPCDAYRDKLGDYPAMGIPDCLIVDPRAGTVEAYSDPCGSRYVRKASYIFGDTVPFGPWCLETEAFRRY